ncbi:unnamed protein product [Darwinula stevensoni]|uniref:Uncharacterized protein n=1 Tax=Darwinula stevensoni TaxID=69355 RepID=A0A7R9A5F4_9CRUS|nr:unnamed protein product [Darwinula stevensoni]CAG0886377.1 unnamed protein product [Darwinula stevensoni]
MAMKFFGLLAALVLLVLCMALGGEAQRFGGFGGGRRGGYGGGGFGRGGYGGGYGRGGFGGGRGRFYG